MKEKHFHVGIKGLVMKDGKILVLKANPEELEGDSTVHWDLPGGRIKEGDDVRVTLHKEMEEELGLNPQDFEMGDEFHGSIGNMDIPTDKGNVGLVLHVYLCKLKTNKGFKLSSEHTEYKWASVEEAKELLSFKFSKSFVEKLNLLDGN